MLSDTQPLNFALSAVQQGMPLTPASQSYLQQGAQGGQGTANFFDTQYQLSQFTTWVNQQGSNAWVQGDDGAGNPTFTATASNGMQMTLATTPDTDVINGQQSPGSFEWNGQSYNIAGSITGTLSYNDLPVWTIYTSIGLVEAVPITILASYAWSGLILPVLTGFWSGVVSCFGSGAAATSADAAVTVAEGAAADAAVDGVIVEGAAVSLAVGAVALVALVILIAIPIALSFILHPSFHNLLVYNLTSSDITWNLAYVDEGAMNMAPVTGQSSDTFNVTIPAMGNIAPPGLKPITVAHQAAFSFVSGSILNGIGYVMEFTATDSGSGAMVLFDIPLIGANSLYATLGTGDAESFYKQYEGDFKQTQFQSPGPDGATITVTYDFTNGEHTAPDGQTGYIYNSLVVIESPASLRQQGIDFSV